MKNVETTTQVKEVKTLGRPVNPTSNRQIRLQELEMRRELGLVKRGRPVDTTSARQFKLQMKSFGLTFGPGRPINLNSKRQQRLQEIESRKQNGTFKLGRPKKYVVTDEIAA
jgi:hypothetical protein